jgi:ferredoxin--NADP+ reductase
MRHVAIVGSGPSGCYCAEAILRAAPDCRVDVIDRMPTPYGLVRFGVAPDHQSTKGVSRLLERVLARPEVGFFGGVELGRDVTLAELRAMYDAVVIATGAGLDRRLGIPGEDLPGVYTSGRFVGWYNHHPDHADVDLRAARAAVIVGSGNVALDVARLLAKSEAEFDGSDLAPGVSAALATSGIRKIFVIGRSAAAALKFSEGEVLELGELERARPVLGHGADLRGLDGKAATALRTIAERAEETARAKPVEIVFEFGLRPIACEGDGRLAAMRFEDPAGDVHLRAADLAVTCIGYESAGHGLALEGGSLRNDDGFIEAGLYVVGWAKRGPSGTIPTNRTEAQTVAKKLVADTTDGGKAGGSALAARLSALAFEHVDYAAWRRIDASEIARADATRARLKWRSLDELRAAAKPAVT